MTVKLHQPVAGLKAGEEYTGPMEPWLVVNGYASRDADTTEKSHLTGVLPAVDPMRAEHREAPGQPFKVLGETETTNPDNAVHTAPVYDTTARNTVLGATEDAATAEQTAELDGRVDPKDVNGFPPELPEAIAAAKTAEQNSNVFENEPGNKTPKRSEPKRRAS